MDAPLIFAAGARAVPGDDDFALAKADQSLVEKRTAPELRPGAPACRESGEEKQRFPAVSHDMRKVGGHIFRIGPHQRRNSCHGPLLPAIESIATDCYDNCSDGARAGQECQEKRRESTGSGRSWRSEEHTSELQSLMRTSYAVICLNKKNNSQRISLILTSRPKRHLMNT